MKSRESYMALARREFASAGGIARAKVLSRQERVKIAHMGGRAGGRGRCKKDRIPEELREKIWELLDREKGNALWWMSDEGLHPRTRTMAKLSLRDLARNGSLRAYKAAHQLAKCL